MAQTASVDSTAPYYTPFEIAKQSGRWGCFGIVVTRIFFSPVHPLAGGVCAALINAISEYALPFFDQFHDEDQSCRSHNAVLNIEIIAIASLSSLFSCALGFPIGFGPAVVLTIPQFYLR